MFHVSDSISVFFFLLLFQKLHYAMFKVISAINPIKNVIHLIWHLLSLPIFVFIFNTFLYVYRIIICKIYNILYVYTIVCIHKYIHMIYLWFISTGWVCMLHVLMCIDGGENISSAPLKHFAQLCADPLITPIPPIKQGYKEKFQYIWWSSIYMIFLERKVIW